MVVVCRHCSSSSDSIRLVIWTLPSDIFVNRETAKLSTHLAQSLKLISLLSRTSSSSMFWTHQSSWHKCQQRNPWYQKHFRQPSATVFPLLTTASTATRAHFCLSSHAEGSWLVFSLVTMFMMMVLMMTVMICRGHAGKLTGSWLLSSSSMSMHWTMSMSMSLHWVSDCKRQLIATGPQQDGTGSLSDHCCKKQLLSNNNNKL